MSVRFLLAGMLCAARCLYGQPYSDEQRRFMAEMDNALGVQPGAIIADIGTGNGFFHPFRIARAVAPAGKVICIDISEAAIQKIRERAQEEGLKTIEVALGTESDPLLKPDSVDAVLISNTYHELTKPEGMLKHIREALKAKGSLVVTEVYSEKRRRDSRAAQAAAHEFSSDLLEAELTGAGFRVVNRIDRILQDADLIRYIVVASKSN